MKHLSLVVWLCFTCRLAVGGEHEASNVEEGAVFKEGVGILLHEVTREAIGLTMLDVGETTLNDVLPFTAQIYREAGEGSQNAGERPGFAYASAILPASSTKGLVQTTNVTVTFDELTATGALIRVDETMEAATGQRELIVEIPDAPAALKIGDFVQATLHKGQRDQVVVLPHQSILNTADRSYVFVRNGGALLRTPVTTGLQQGDQVEILEGLYAGDEVAATAVETLYLIELRATKGGGHCH